MKQKAFAWGFIFFFVVTFIALWGDDGFSSIDIWGFVLVCIPCGFVGFLGGAIAMVMVKNNTFDWKGMGFHILSSQYNTVYCTKP